MIFSIHRNNLQRISKKLQNLIITVRDIIITKRQQQPTQNNNLPNN